MPPVTIAEDATVAWQGVPFVIAHDALVDRPTRHGPAAGTSVSSTREARLRPNGGSACEYVRDCSGATTVVRRWLTTSTFRSCRTCVPGGIGSNRVGATAPLLGTQSDTLVEPYVTPAGPGACARCLCGGRTPCGSHTREHLAPVAEVAQACRVFGWLRLRHDHE